MTSSMRRVASLCAFFVISALMWSTQNAAQAAKADREAPTKIDADRLDHDDQKLVTVFSGNVSLTKGSLVLRGDRLELRQQPDGTSQGVLTGRPARFRQKREGVDEWMVGESLRIDYDSKTEIAILSEQAMMRRLAGESVMDQVSGDRVVYNNVTEVYGVEVKPGQARARMTLMPRPSQPAE
ncbi:MAG: lipopolysaccharide transport periplasmic protein LptA [Pseudomonadota bacterium]